MNKLQFEMKDIENGATVKHQVIYDAAEMDLEVDAEGFARDSTTDATFIHPISGKVQLFRQGEHVYVTAELSTVVEVECGRCLEIFETMLNAHFGVQYRPTSDPEQVGWWDESEGIRYYFDENIDITEDVLQAVVVEIPLWPICSEDCKGLCSQCGHNLNLGDCSCIRWPRKYSQFAALEELLPPPKQAKEVIG